MKILKGLLGVGMIASSVASLTPSIKNNDVKINNNENTSEYVNTINNTLNEIVATSTSDTEVDVELLKSIRTYDYSGNYSGSFYDITKQYKKFQILEDVKPLFSSVSSISWYDAGESFNEVANEIIGGATLVDVYNNYLDNLYVDIDGYPIDSNLDNETIYIKMRDFVKIKCFETYNGSIQELVQSYSVLNGVLRVNIADDTDYLTNNGGCANSFNLGLYADSFSDGNIYVDGSDVHCVVNVSSPLTFSEICSKITAIDETDGNLSGSINYNTTYPMGTDLSGLKIGSYPVNFDVTDTSGNTTVGTFTIDVFDITAPTFSNTSIESRNDKLLSTNEIIELVGISDNYNSFGDLEIVVSGYDEYANKYTIGGSYKLSITATDSSGNDNTKEITINNLDKVLPVFTTKDNSPFELANGTLITYLSNNIDINVEFLKSLLKATDETNGDVSSSITLVRDDFTENKNVVSNTPYDLVFSCKDLSNNETILTIKIYVVDDLPPVVCFGNDFYISVGTKISEVQLIEYLKNLYNLNTATYINVSSNYFIDDNSSKVGTYACSVSCLDSDNNLIKSISLNIITTEKTSIEEETPKTKKQNWFVRIWKKFTKWVNKWWNKFLNIFK